LKEISAQKSREYFSEERNQKFKSSIEKMVAQNIDSPPQSVETSGVDGLFAVGFQSDKKPLQSEELARIPRRLRVFSRLAFMIFLVFSVTVSFVPWTQTVTVQGKLSAHSATERPQEIHSQINGSIQNWYVHEGDSVKKGDLVLELGDVNPKFMAPDLLERLDQSRDALEQRRQAALDRAKILETRIEEMTNLTQAASSSAEARVSEADNKTLSAEQRTAAAEISRETADLNLQRSRVLESQGLLSRRELELAIQASTKAEAGLKAAQAEIRETQEGRRALEHNRDQIDAELVQRFLSAKSQRTSALGEAAKASKELADLELTRSNAMQRRVASKVLAPFGGTVVRLTPLGPGEIVHPKDLLFTIVPESTSPAIEMWANAMDAPLLKPGRSVRLLFQGIPAIPLPAWPELMAGTYHGRIQVVDQSASPNGQFRFWVEPDLDPDPDLFPEGRKWPPQEQVRQGTKAMGWVILNRVPLWYEMWRRFNLFPPDYKTGQVSLTDVFLSKAGRGK
jgi:multidrug efflux pump subunit AcrA (membrane-fusion protein)